MNLSVDQAVNIFPHRNEVPGGKGPSAGMISRPGYSAFGISAPTGTGRGLIPGEQRMFTVVGQELYEVDSSGNYTLLGNIGTGSSPCTMVFNGNQVGVLNPNTGALFVNTARNIIGFADAGGLVEVTFDGPAPLTSQTVVFSGTGAAGIDGTSTVTQTGANTATVDGSTWPGGSPPAQGLAVWFAHIAFFIGGDVINFTSIFYLDGYLFGILRDTNEVYQSDLLDMSTWDPINQGTFVAAPDRLQGGFSYRDGVFLVGSATSQYVTNSGAAGFVLSKVQSTFVQQGTCAPFSPIVIDEVLCMISLSRQGFGRVIAMRPGGFQRISNYAVEQDLKQITDFGNVTTAAQQWEGHNFLIIDIPTLGKQWWYDFTEKAWWQAYKSGASVSYLDMNQRFYCCTFGNNYYAQQRDTGALWKMRTDGVKRDASLVFRAQRTAPVLYNGDRFNVNELRVDMQAGADGTAANQVASLRPSVDGGLTFGSYLPEQAGRNGEDGVLVWPQLGQVGNRGFVADVVWDGEYDVAVAGARISATPGLA